MKSYKNVAQVGDVIKSYDFNGVDSCYIIGKVIEKSDTCDLGNFGAFKIDLIQMVRENIDVTKKQKEIDNVFYVPFEFGLFEKSDWNRVVKLY